jgi:hypothetical protein
MIAAQLVSLIAVFAAMGALALYLSRSPTADELYASVAERGGDEDAPLGSVEPQIKQFLTLYPQDPRAAELRRYQERIELQKLERKLHRQARDSGSADPGLLPAEQLYVRAADLVDTAPDQSIRLFESLIHLYGPATAGTENEKVAAVVELAKERLKTLRGDVQKLYDRQRAALAERLAVAQQLSKSDPGTAFAMYEAIIILHERDAWASDAVGEARARLKEFVQHP